MYAFLSAWRNDFFKTKEFVQGAGPPTPTHSCQEKPQLLTINLLPVKTWILQYTYKHYPTSSYLKKQENFFLLRRGAANHYYCKA